MNKKILYILLFVMAFLTGCADHDELDSPTMMTTADAHELRGVQAVIMGGPQGALTRSGKVTTLDDYVGRDSFVTNDTIVFTKIKRTEGALDHFTYPSDTSSYDGIDYVAGSAGGWSRYTADGGPERIYWTDALNDHTFIGYSKPLNYIGDKKYEWKVYNYVNGGTKINYYIGSLGDPTITTDTIDYTLTTAEQTTYTQHVNNKTVYSNPKVDNEDLLIAYDEHMQSEPGGSVALVRFYHALSSIRVVVNISEFSTSTSADTATVVSNMRLLHQPTMYIWMQADSCAQPLRASGHIEGVTDQTVVNSAWGGSGPSYDQRKPMKLWIPQPKGKGSKQSKTFTFYGITTPQPENYISTLDADDVNRKVELVFDVTYPNPMKPSQTQTKTYTATLSDTVYFKAGYNTTINISLNHKNEKMTVGAQYQNWQFVATPDAGKLKKNSTLLADTERSSVTIVGDELATVDDATWLYEESEGVIKDIYGNDGSTSDKAYKICTAYQLLSLAYEVRNGRTFENQFIRLDADLTLQTSSDKTLDEIMKLDTTGVDVSKYTAALDWIGIGDAKNPFQGTFRGGERYIYRLNGKPLFNNIGDKGCVRHIQMTVINIEDGSGAIAETNSGLICGSYIMGDVGLSSTTGGAFVGTNTSTGKIYCSYHIGDTESTATADNISLGGLVGTNQSGGEIANCYQAGKIEFVPNLTTDARLATKEAIAASNSGTITNCYYNSNMLTPTTTFTEGVIEGKTSSYMTKQAFVDKINSGINSWHESHDEYDWHQFQHNPANYPTLSQTIRTK